MWQLNRNLFKLLFVADDKLLVGTKQGHLMMYSIGAKDFAKVNVQLLQYNKTFSKKPIQQIAAIPEHDILLKLSDNIISIHQLSDANFCLIKPLEKTRGATLFALNTKVYCKYFIIINKLSKKEGRQGHFTI